MALKTKRPAVILTAGKKLKVVAVRHSARSMRCFTPFNMTALHDEAHCHSDRREESQRSRNASQCTLDEILHFVQYDNGML
jgi:hypothetical protein